MRSSRKKSILKVFLILTALIISLSGAAGYYLLSTPNGCRMLVRMFVKYYAPGSRVDFQDMTGSLRNGVEIKGMSVTELPYFPAGTKLMVQGLSVKIPLKNVRAVSLTLDQARLQLPKSNPVMVSGSFEPSSIHATVFSAGFSIAEIFDYLGRRNPDWLVGGSAAQLDAVVSGTVKKPVVAGSLLIEEFKHKRLTLLKAPVKFRFTVEDLKKWHLQGTAVFAERKGEVLVAKAKIKLQEGHVRVSGPVKEASYHFKGRTKVAGTRIDITVNGAGKEPKLELSSQSSLPQEELMVMLATGKKWSGMSPAPGQNGLGSGLSGDFIDYFLLSGRANRFTDRFGITDVNVQFDKNEKGISAKKEFSDKIEIGYGIGKNQDENTASVTTTQTLQGEVHMTDSLSVGVERELKSQPATQDYADNINTRSETNDTVYMKYEKNF